MASVSSKKTVAKKASKSVAKKASKSVAKKASKSVAKKASKSVAKEASKSVAKEASKSVAKKASKSVAKEASKSVAKKASKSVASVAKEVAVDASQPAAALGAGEVFPSFSLFDQSGSEVTLAALSGKPFVLFFYPKADTPGCTTEACGFRDEFAGFTDLGVRVLGVSPDAPGTQAKFDTKYSLGYSLLADSEHTLATALGVWQLKKNYGREYMGVVRSTFLVDAEGRVARAWRGVRVAGHVAEVLLAAREL